MKIDDLCFKCVIILGALASGHVFSASYEMNWPTLISPVWGEAYYNENCRSGCRDLEFTVAQAKVQLNVDPSTTTLKQITGGGGTTYRAESYTKLSNGVWWTPSYVAVNGDMTLTEVHNLMSSTFPNGKKIKDRIALNSVKNYVCSGISVGVPASYIGISWYGYQINRYFGSLSADESCTNVPPNPGEYCAMATSSITMDYGTLASSAAQNAAVTANVKIQCTNAMKYVLRLPGRQKNIYLSNGMSAEITADGKALGSTLDGVAGSNNIVTITSTLTGTPTRTGSFSGNSVLGVEYP